jgi:hypothetical protein
MKSEQHHREGLRGIQDLNGVQPIAVRACHVDDHKLGLATPHRVHQRLAFRDEHDC